MSERDKPYRQVSVRAIVLHEGKLLCVRQKHYHGAVVDIADNWCLPGGGLEAGEALEDGLRREMLEETGIAAEVGNLLYIQQFSHAGTEFLEFFFHVTNSQDYLEVDLSKSTHGELEIAEVGFVEPATTSILPEFLMTDDLTAQAAAGKTKVVSLI